MIDVFNEPMLEAWLRHVKWAIAGAELPATLKQAEKRWPIMKDARHFLGDEDYRALVGTLDPKYRESVRAT